MRSAARQMPAPDNLPVDPHESDLESDAEFRQRIDDKLSEVMAEVKKNDEEKSFDRVQAHELASPASSGVDKVLKEVFARRKAEEDAKSQEAAKKEVEPLRLVRNAEQQSESAEAREARPETMSKMAIAKEVGKMMVGVTGSLLGVKSLVDIPRWLRAKYNMKKDSPVLRNAFDEALKSHEDMTRAEIKGAEREAQVKSVADNLRTQIDQAKGLNNVQKRRLEGKVDEILDKYMLLRPSHRRKAQAEFAQAIDAELESKVKGTTVVKEGLNSALMVSGLSMLRSAAYGSVALYERHKRVKAEMGEGKRSEGYAKEMFVNGFKETWQALKGEGESKRERVMGRVKAVGTVARFLGMTNIAVQELTEEGVSGSIDKMFDHWEAKSAGEFAKDNFVENVHRLTFGAFEDDKPEVGDIAEPRAPHSARPENPDIDEALKDASIDEDKGQDLLDNMPGDEPVVPDLENQVEAYPVPETYEIKGGEGPLHAIRHLHDDPEVQEHIVAAMRDEHPEWDKLSDKRVLVKWRLSQLKEMGGSLTGDGEVYSMTVHEGAKFNLEWDDDGMPHVRPVDDEKIWMHEAREKVYEDVTEVVSEVVEPTVEVETVESGKIEFTHGPNGEVIGMSFVGEPAGFKELENDIVLKMKNSFEGQSMTDAEAAKLDAAAREFTENHYMMAALEKSMMGEGPEAAFVRARMEEFVNNYGDTLKDGITVDDVEAVAKAEAVTLETHDRFGHDDGGQVVTSVEFSPAQAEDLDVDEVDGGLEDEPDVIDLDPIDGEVVEDSVEDAELEVEDEVGVEAVPRVEAVQKVTLGTRGEARFIRNAQEDIVTMRSSVEIHSNESVLVDRLRGKSFSEATRGAPIRDLARKAYESDSRLLYKDALILREMQKQGVGDSAEAQFMAKRIMGLVASGDKNYGKGAFNMDQLRRIVKI